MTAVVEIKDLSRSYGRQIAVQNINLALKAGEITGLLGPNGCGKTTLIKSIAGLLQPDKGEIKINGQKPALSYDYISYLPENSYLDDWQDMNHALWVFEKFYLDFDLKKAKEMLDEFGLDLQKPLKSMSKGMREKAQLALVMSRKAMVYLLDEPMGGIDPAARQTILESILKNYAPESSLLLSTHLVSDVEMILDRVLFMSAGEILQDRYVEEIRAAEKQSIDEYFRRIYSRGGGGKHDS